MSSPNDSEPPLPVPQDHLKQFNFTGNPLFGNVGAAVHTSAQRIESPTGEFSANQYIIHVSSEHEYDLNLKIENDAPGAVAASGSPGGAGSLPDSVVPKLGTKTPEFGAGGSTLAAIMAARREREATMGGGVGLLKSPLVKDMLAGQSLASYHQPPTIQRIPSSQESSPQSTVLQSRGHSPGDTTFVVTTDGAGNIKDITASPTNSAKNSPPGNGISNAPSSSVNVQSASITQQSPPRNGPVQISSSLPQNRQPLLGRGGQDSSPTQNASPYQRRPLPHGLSPESRAYLENIMSPLGSQGSQSKATASKATFDLTLDERGRNPDRSFDQSSTNNMSPVIGSVGATSPTQRRDGDSAQDLSDSKNPMENIPYDVFRGGSPNKSPTNTKSDYATLADNIIEDSMARSATDLFAEVQNQAGNHHKTASSGVSPNSQADLKSDFTMSNDEIEAQLQQEMTNLAKTREYFKKREEILVSELCKQKDDDMMDQRRDYEREVDRLRERCRAYGIPMSGREAEPREIDLDHDYDDYSPRTLMPPTQVQELQIKYRKLMLDHAEVKKEVDYEREKRLLSDAKCKKMEETMREMEKNEEELKKGVEVLKEKEETLKKELSEMERHAQRTFEMERKLQQELEAMGQNANMDKAQLKEFEKEIQELNNKQQEYAATVGREHSSVVADLREQLKKVEEECARHSQTLKDRDEKIDEQRARQSQMIKERDEKIEEMRTKVLGMEADHLYAKRKLEEFVTKDIGVSMKMRKNRSIKSMRQSRSVTDALGGIEAAFDGSASPTNAYTGEQKSSLFGTERSLDIKKSPDRFDDDLGHLKVPTMLRDKVKSGNVPSKAHSTDPRSKDSKQLLAGTTSSAAMWEQKLEEVQENLRTLLAENEDYHEIVFELETKNEKLATIIKSERERWHKKEAKWRDEVTRMNEQIAELGEVEKELMDALDEVAALNAEKNSPKKRLEGLRERIKRENSPQQKSLIELWNVPMNLQEGGTKEKKEGQTNDEEIEWGDEEDIGAIVAKVEKEREGYIQREREGREQLRKIYEEEKANIKLMAEQELSAAVNDAEARMSERMDETVAEMQAKNDSIQDEKSRLEYELTKDKRRLEVELKDVRSEYDSMVDRYQKLLDQQTETEETKKRLEKELENLTSDQTKGDKTKGHVMEAKSKTMQRLLTSEMHVVRNKILEVKAKVEKSIADSTLKYEDGKRHIVALEDTQASVEEMKDLMIDVLVNGDGSTIQSEKLKNLLDLTNPNANLGVNSNFGGNANSGCNSNLGGNPASASNPGTSAMPGNSGATTAGLENQDVNSMPPAYGMATRGFGWNGGPQRTNRILPVADRLEDVASLRKKLLVNQWTPHVGMAGGPKNFNNFPNPSPGPLESVVSKSAVSDANSAKKRTPTDQPITHEQFYEILKTNLQGLGDTVHELRADLEVQRIVEELNARHRSEIEDLNIQHKLRESTLESKLAVVKKETREQCETIIREKVALVEAFYDKEMKRISEENNKMKARENDLLKLLAKTEEKITEAHNDHHETRKAHQTLQEEHERVRTSLTVMADLEARHAELQDLFATKEQDVRTLRQNLQELNEQIVRADQHNSGFNLANQVLSDQLRQREQDIADAHNKVAAAHEKLAGHSDVIDGHRKSIEEHKLSLVEKDGLIRQLEAARDEQETMILSLQNVVREMRGIVTELQEQIKDLRIEKQALETKLEYTRTEESKVRMQYVETDAKLQTLAETTNRRNQALSTLGDQFRDQIAASLSPGREILENKKLVQADTVDAEVALLEEMLNAHSMQLQLWQSQLRGGDGTSLGTTQDATGKPSNNVFTVGQVPLHAQTAQLSPRPQVSPRPTPGSTQNNLQSRSAQVCTPSQPELATTQGNPRPQEVQLQNLSPRPSTTSVNGKPDLQINNPPGGPSDYQPNCQSDLSNTKNTVNLQDAQISYVEPGWQSMPRILHRPPPTNLPPHFKPLSQICSPPKKLSDFNLPANRIVVNPSQVSVNYPIPRDLPDPCYTHYQIELVTGKERDHTMQERNVANPRENTFNHQLSPTLRGKPDQNQMLFYSEQNAIQNDPTENAIQEVEEHGREDNHADQKDDGTGSVPAGLRKKVLATTSEKRKVSARMEDLSPGTRVKGLLERANALVGGTSDEGGAGDEMGKVAITRQTRSSKERNLRYYKETEHVGSKSASDSVSSKNSYKLGARDIVLDSANPRLQEETHRELQQASRQASSPSKAKAVLGKNTNKVGTHNHGRVQVLSANPSRSPEKSRKVPSASSTAHPVAGHYPQMQTISKGMLNQSQHAQGMLSQSQQAQGMLNQSQHAQGMLNQVPVQFNNGLQHPRSYGSVPYPIRTNSLPSAPTQVPDSSAVYLPIGGVPSGGQPVPGPGRDLFKMPDPLHVTKKRVMESINNELKGSAETNAEKSSSGNAEAIVNQRNSRNDTPGPGITPKLRSASVYVTPSLNPARSMISTPSTNVTPASVPIGSLNLSQSAKLQHANSDDKKNPAKKSTSSFALGWG